jgi:transcription elongation factor Elf1
MFESVWKSRPAGKRKVRARMALNLFWHDTYRIYLTCPFLQHARVSKGLLKLSSISHVYSRSKPDLLLVNLTMAQQIANRIEDGWIAVRVVTFFVDAYNQHKSNGL